MNITIHRDDVSYGPYSIEQIKTLVSQHRLGSRDMARVEGETRWVPLENLIIQDSFRRQRAAYVAEVKASSQNPNPKKKTGGKHANRWLWKPE